MTRLSLIISSIVVVLVIGFGAMWWVSNPKPTPPPPIIEEVPAVTDLNDRIQVTAPAVGDVVTSPLTIAGKARGPWFFEASFPVKMLDSNNQELGVTTAQAQGDWMTEDFVPFTATVTFTTPTTAMGTLLLQKDNPSGLPENDAALGVPVRFVP